MDTRCQKKLVPTVYHDSGGQKCVLVPEQLHRMQSPEQLGMSQSPVDTVTWACLVDAPHAPAHPPNSQAPFWLTYLELTVSEPFLKEGHCPGTKSRIEAESHAWVECMDWKFKDPKKWSWLEKDGRCEGYARRFPVGEKPFGGLDSNSPHRHFEQKHNYPDSQPACSNGGNGQKKDTFDETLSSPPELAYRGKSRSGKSYGPMTVKKAGERLCIRWPAKNHQYLPGATSVYIGISGVNPTSDPTQREFINRRIAELDYNNCSNGSADLKPCGGCFNLPKDLQVGYYAVQWRWSEFVDEWYTSCADIKIIE